MSHFTTHRTDRRTLLRGMARLGALGAGAALLQACGGSSTSGNATPQAKKVARIGVLWSGGDYLPTFTDKELGPELAKLGRMASRDYVWETRNADNHPERYPELAAELAQLPCDIFAIASTLIAVALQKAAPNVPIVVQLTDALNPGLV